MTVPHITIEQASVLYTNAEPMLKLSNELIDKHNARAEQATEQPLISAEEARKLGAGKAEWRWSDEYAWAIVSQKTGGLGYAPDAQYRAIKQPELIPLNWKDVPVGAMTNRGMFLKSSFGYSQVLTNDSPFCVADVEESELELAPASEQPWIAVQDDQDYIKLYQQLEQVGLVVEGGAFVYRITGLAKGYGYPEQKGGC